MTTDPPTVRAQVGFWWSDKKGQKMSGLEFERLLAEKDIRLVKLDMDAPLAPQGPFQLIVHKLSDIVAKADGGDAKAHQQIRAFEAYVKEEGDMTVIDPMEGVRILMDRYRQYSLIDESELAREDGVFTPPFVEIKTNDIVVNSNKLKEAGVNFPFVCKPLMAHGSKSAHQMSLIFCEDGLKDMKLPCVAQSFINHNARLFKLFIIKDKYYVIERPSLKNFKPGDFPTVYFDSHHISKPHSSSSLTELDEHDQSAFPAREPDNSRLDRIVRVVREKLGLALFGIDLIIENETGRYAIIDMNAFPGYDGVDNFLELLRDLIVEEIERKSQPSYKSNSESTSKKTASSQTETYDDSAASFPIVVEATETATATGSRHGSSGSIEESRGEAEPENGLSSEPEKSVIETHNDIDSGIDTSDSCDEKKNKPLPVKAIRRLHSKTSTSPDSRLSN